MTRVPQQGTYMTKGDRWITYSSPADIREKVNTFTLNHVMANVVINLAWNV